MEQSLSEMIFLYDTNDCFSKDRCRKQQNCKSIQTMDSKQVKVLKMNMET